MHLSQNEERPAPSRVRRGGLKPRAIERVMAHIEGNIGANLTLDVLASVACLSKSHFASMFRLSIGHSPMAYVRRRRIELARLELARGNPKLSGLATELGFCDQSHFTNIFRRMIGCTPGKYALRPAIQ